MLTGADPQALEWPTGLFLSSETVPTPDHFYWLARRDPVALVWREEIASGLQASPLQEHYLRSLQIIKIVRLLRRPRVMIIVIRRLSTSRSSYYCEGFVGLGIIYKISVASTTV